MKRIILIICLLAFTFNCVMACTDMSIFYKNNNLIGYKAEKTFCHKV